MTFLELYGTELDRRLGSDDTLELFTNTRRKDAINKAQEWFLLQTGCLWKTAAIPLADGVGEYDLQTLIFDETFIDIAAQSPVIKITRSSGAIEYISGPDSFPRRTMDWLDQEEEGWRSADASTPEAWYTRQEGAATIIGVTPPPDIASGETWELQVPYVAQADTMVDDTDEPFTLDTVTKVGLRPWHGYLADYGAYQLEQLRKGLDRSAAFLQLAQAGVKDYLDKVRTPGAGVVMTQKRYFRDRREVGPWGSRWGRWWG